MRFENKMCALIIMSSQLKSQPGGNYVGNGDPSERGIHSSQVLEAINSKSEMLFLENHKCLSLLFL